MKNIFTTYSNDYSGKKLINLRQFNKFAKDFNFFEKFDQLNKAKLDLLITKRIKNIKNVDFASFIDILYYISNKYLIKSIKNQSKDKNLNFLLFIDNVLINKYEELNLKFYEKNIDKITIFQDSFDEKENPIIWIFCHNHDLLNHVFFNYNNYLNHSFNLFKKNLKIFSLYETLDMKISNKPFIYYNNFSKFCNDYCIIPSLCNYFQINKVY